MRDEGISELAGLKGLTVARLVEERCQLAARVETGAEGGVFQVGGGDGERCLRRGCRRLGEGQGGCGKWGKAHGRRDRFSAAIGAGDGLGRNGLAGNGDRGGARR